MSTLNLHPDCMKLIQKIIAEHAPHAVIWAYGSRVSGTCHEASDLDLVLRHTGKLTTPSSAVLTLKQAFQKSDLPIFVDIMDWALLPESYQQEITKNYVVLPEATE